MTMTELELQLDRSVTLAQRIKQLEKLNATLAAEVDRQREREQALSAAYLRLRQLIGRKAFDTPYGPTGEQVWITTEAALVELVAEINTLRLHAYEAAKREGGDG
jgi:hypothetical protein